MGKVKEHKEESEDEEELEVPEPQEEEQEIKEEKKEVKKEEQIQLIQVPTEFQFAFKTPEGDMDLHTYLVWLGNITLKVKKELLG